MTRIYLRAAGVLAAAGIAVAIVAAAPAPAGQTISFTERGISDHSFSLGPGHGFAVGRVELVATKLMQDSKQIGHDGESYTVTRLSRRSADEMVSVSEVFAHGQIDLAGLVTSTPSGPGTFRLAVTGGYQDARGYATVTPGPAPHVTIHLTP